MLVFEKDNVFHLFEKFRDAEKKEEDEIRHFVFVGNAVEEVFMNGGNFKTRVILEVVPRLLLR